MHQIGIRQSDCPTCRLSQTGPPPQTFTKSQSPSQDSGIRANAAEVSGNYANFEEDEILTVMMRNIPNKMDTESFG